jgi:hypothetical protein
MSSAKVIKTNYLYYTLVGTLLIGTPPQELTVLFDTGSNRSWIRSSNCVSNECHAKKSFDASKSSSYQLNPAIEERTLIYRDGTSVQCMVNEDVITIGGFTQSNMNICEANHIKTPLESADGVIGIGSPYSSEQTDFFARLVKSNATTPIISFWYNRKYDFNDGMAGEILLGEMDGSKFKHPMEYTPIIPGKAHWSISIELIETFERSLISEPLEVIADTGTSFFLLTPTIFAKVTSHMKLNLVDGFYYLDCDHIRDLPSIKFKLKGNLSLNLEWYLQVLFNEKESTCLSIFQPTSGSASGQGSIMGALFLRNFYTVFDYQNEQIGFANLAEEFKLETSGSPTLYRIIITILSISFVRGIL